MKTGDSEMNNNSTAEGNGSVSEEEQQEQEQPQPQSEVSATTSSSSSIPTTTAVSPGASTAGGGGPDDGGEGDASVVEVAATAAAASIPSQDDGERQASDDENETISSSPQVEQTGEASLPPQSTTTQAPSTSLSPSASAAASAEAATAASSFARAAELCALDEKAAARSLRRAATKAMSTPPTKSQKDAKMPSSSPSSLSATAQNLRTLEDEKGGRTMSLSSPPPPPLDHQVVDADVTHEIQPLPTDPSLPPRPLEPGAFACTGETTVRRTGKEEEEDQDNHTVHSVGTTTNEIEVVEEEDGQTTALPTGAVLERQHSGGSHTNTMGSSSNSSRRRNNGSRPLQDDSLHNTSVGTNPSRSSTRHNTHPTHHSSWDINNNTNSNGHHHNVEDDLRSLPIAAELAPDRESLEREIEARIRQEWEQRMVVAQAHQIVPTATASVDDLGDELPNTSTVVMEQVDFDRSRPFEIEAGNSNDFDFTRNNNNVHTRSIAKKKRSKIIVTTVAFFILVLAGTGIGLYHARKDSPSSSSSISSGSGSNNNGSMDAPVKRLPVLQTVRERGMLLCKPESLEAELGEGFTLDLCRAIAAAIFNDTSKVLFPQMSFKEHFGAIHRGEMDVSASHVSLNMGRDVWELNSRTGYTYSTPYFYTGTGLAGVPKFVDCAEQADTFNNDCRQLKVCVTTNTVTQDIVEAHLPGSATMLTQSHVELFELFANGTCNVIAGDTVLIFEQRVREVGYIGDYKFAKKLLSHEHLALLTREDAPDWADFCNWVLHALITAEALNITQQSAHTFAKSNMFGPEYENMFIQAIAAVGNYGELYERHYKGILPRSRYNMINTGDTGLIVSDPLGNLDVDEESLSSKDLPNPLPNGTIEAVVQRGHLLCGVIPDDDNVDDRHQPAFAFFNTSSQEWSGLDVDLCRGLAASVSAGKYIDTVLVNLSSRETRYISLANSTVDVLAGDMVSFTNDLLEPSSGRGFFFGTPYFYHEREGGNADESSGARALVTRHDDPQWSDLTKWITHATFYAEEKGITQRNASMMPIVELFGISYRQMFRDAINATGNYGEIYSRNVESYIPRSGRNLLNVDDTPQFYPIPFL